MTIFESHRVFIGASGWLHQHWHEQFYPEDLPAEWQLAYYGNEFPVVLIREQEWQQAGKVADWLEDTEDSPLFICELPLQGVISDAVNAAEPYLQKINQLGKRCLGIVCRVNNEIRPDELGLLLEKCNELASTCVDVDEPHTEALQDMLRSQSVSLVWNKVSEPKEVNGSLVVANLSSEELSLKDLRQLMDKLLQYDDEQHVIVLLVGGDKPDLEIIRQAKMMLELM